MTQTLNTEAIVLARTNFGEADRILTVLTPDYGKRRLMAKGVRKERSKMAGGIELFSVSYISYIPGKSEIDTLISTRLKKHYGRIVENIERTMLGYELLKRLNRATEDASGEEYFMMLEYAMKALDDLDLNFEIVELWFNARLLKVSGHQPNLTTDITGEKLDEKRRYNLNVENMIFEQHPQGRYRADNIKLLRLAFGTENPLKLKNIQAIDKLLPATKQLVSAMLTAHVRI